MAEAKDNAPSWTERLGRSVRISAVILASLAAAFAILLLINSQAIVGNTHKRNAHNLEVIADILENWPRVYGQVAKLQYEEQLQKPGSQTGTPSPTEAVIMHPDLGTIRISYVDCVAQRASLARKRPLFPRGDRPGEGSQFPITGSFKSGTTEICYETQVPIARLAGLSRTAPDLSHLIIIGEDKSVQVQVGSSSLPVIKLPPLSPVNSFAKDLAANVLSEDEQSDGEVALETTTGAARTRVSDRDYFVYVQPIRIDAPKALCPAAKTESTKGGAGTTGTASGATQSAGAQPPKPEDSQLLEPCQLYAIGFMPSDVLRRAWLAPPPLILIGFGLALLIALALLPVTRLLMIGGTEAVSAIEVGAIVFGVYAAASVATLAVLFAIELSGERMLATNEAQANARRLARVVSADLADFRNTVAACAIEGRATAKGLQLVYEAGPLNEDGSAKTTTASDPACASKPITASANVGGRQYFKDLQQAGDANPQAEAITARAPDTPQDVGSKAVSPDYRFSQVIAQSDGLNKTIVVLKWRDPAAKADAPPSYFLASTVLRELIAPILPSPQRFMIVDTGSDKLPVLFHQNRARAGIEALASQIQGPDQIAAVLRRLPAAGPEGTVGFTRRYDGEVLQFSAARISGSSWVVLVYHRLDDVDAIAAQSTARALTGWASITLPAMAIGVILLLLRRGAWRYLWPFYEAEPIYRQVLPGLLGGSLLIAMIGVIDLPLGPLLAVLIATGGAFAIFWALQKKQLTATPLTVAHEQAYRRFVLGMILFIAVAPMVAFWTDARSLSRDLVDVERREAVAYSVSDRYQQINALRAIPSARPIETHWPDDRFNPWKRPTVPAMATLSRQGGFSRTLLEWQTRLPFAPIYHCNIEQSKDQARTQLRAWYCWPRHPLAGKSLEIGVTARDSAFPTSIPTLSLIFIIALGLAVLIYAAVYFGLWSLTGFGIPLGAVSWPKLVIGGGPFDRSKNELPLATKSLLVAPQQAVRDRVSDSGEAQVVNVADVLIPLPESSFAGTAGQALILLPAWQKINNKPAWLVVSGLELILRDPDRRRVALTYLERAAAEVSRQSQGDLKGLVVIAEMSPLERILDAFDTFGKTTDTDADVREELRWARLFQDFTTFSFAPIDKVDDVTLKQEIPDRNSTARILVEELRWLPGNVIDGVLAIDNSTTIREATDLHFPIPEARYKKFYSDEIIKWAKSAEALTPEAAVDYMRANLIEHYEQCWIASSLAERVILDAIARKSYVNMRKAVALQSLVRRGLVIMDPAPRLMNESFAFYIRQAERPDTLERWRKQQPRSPWALARLPLAIMLPVLVIALTMAAAESGQELTALFSLLAAGMPALVGTFVRAAKGG